MAAQKKNSASNVLPPVHSRSFARLYAMRLLYQSELSGLSLEEMAAAAPFDLSQDNPQDCLYECEKRQNCEQYNFFEQFSLEPPPYALTLVAGVQEHQAALDALIAETSKHWTVVRMPPVDRAIVRLAVWEMCYNNDIPDSVAINEAVKLAKEYGGGDSSKYANGVLGRIAEKKVTSHV